MITLNINLSEKKRLLSFYEDIENAGHWGNSSIEIPEEKGLYNIIKNSSEEISLTIFQADMLCDWIFTASGEGILLIPDDSSLIGKIYNALNDYYSDLHTKYSFELNSIGKIILQFHKLAPGIIKTADSFRKLEKIETAYLSNNTQSNPPEENYIKTAATELPNYYTKKSLTDKMLKTQKTISEKIIEFFRYTFEKKDADVIPEKITISAKDRLENAKHLAKKIKKL